VCFSYSDMSFGVGNSVRLLQLLIVKIRKSSINPTSKTPSVVTHILCDNIYIFTCTWVHVTNNNGSRSDDWIY
jgi:hypothetical protein